MNDEDQPPISGTRRINVSVEGGAQFDCLIETLQHDAVVQNAECTGFKPLQGSLDLNADIQVRSRAGLRHDNRTFTGLPKNVPLVQVLAVEHFTHRRLFQPVLDRQRGDLFGHGQANELGDRQGQRTRGQGDRGQQRLLACAFQAIAMNHELHDAFLASQASRADGALAYPGLQ
ncbi:hypothetical protein TK06_09055 [Pseudomonas fluorescens]|uniref:Uncharacterized protein n=1 Tax=Pseudomonas fluorescens TaxID=294 RepID=A0A159ZU83_PSEFL|nr:hypothetical protein TK06_09055 [Pseudomonas fluorescens]